VQHLSVPVRGADGAVVLVLRLSALPRAASPARIASWVERLRQAAASLEARIAAQLQVRDQAQA